MGLLVVHPGVSTTVQDLGRPGYRAWGVPVGGAFDASSAGLANALLGNDPGCAVLEFTLVGGTYQALAPLALALAGASLEATIRTVAGETRSVPIPSVFPLKEGDRLILRGASRGARTYLGVLGGWQTPIVLGSRSSETRLQAGDRLECHEGSVPRRYVKVPQTGLFDDPIRIIAGPDASLLKGEGLNAGCTYKVGPQCDRMGLRLDGPTWPIRAGAGAGAGMDRESTPVAPGALQAPGGSPLLLGVACGTMGGYPHVAHVISADLDRVAQLRTGDTFRFAIVGLDEARRLDRVFRVERTEWHKRVATAVSDRFEEPSRVV